jgi:hypothetical protein
MRALVMRKLLRLSDGLEFRMASCIAFLKRKHARNARALSKKISRVFIPHSGVRR